MDRLIYTYALVKSHLEHGEDYIDSFWPLAAGQISPRTYAEVTSIQNRIKEEHGLDIPQHVLSAILKRAKKQGYLEVDHKRYRLTSEGEYFIGTFDTKADVDREINSLLDDASTFFASNNIELSREQTYDILLSFLNRNTDYLTEVINPKDVQFSKLSKRLTAEDRTILEYFKEIEAGRPELYRILEKVVRGSIISVVLHSQDANELNVITSRRFKDCEVFLDTNFVFNLLDMQGRNLVDPAKELFQLLLDFGFKIKVFDFTISEISRVLGGYIREYPHYPSSVAVDSVYGYLKTKGWGPIEVREFISNVEETLETRGIAIEWTDFSDPSSYQPSDEGIRYLIGQYKPFQNTFTQSHDLLAIEKIRQIRNKPRRRFEEAKAIFLTSDEWLCKFDFKEMHHSENGTICEAILDRALTTLLWLKNPSIELPLQSIIALYSKELAINRHIWLRFDQIVRHLRATGRITDESISMLFYGKYIEEELRNISESEIESIDDEFVLAKVEAAGRLIEETEIYKIAEIEAHYMEQLEKKTYELDQRKELESLESVNAIKERARNNSRTKARTYLLWIRIISSLVLLVPLVVLAVCANWIALTAVAGIYLVVPIVLRFTVLDSYDDMWRKLRVSLTERFYKKMTKNLGLE